jgi:hypothetical protein
VKRTKKKIKISGAGEYCGKREGEGCRGRDFSLPPAKKLLSKKKKLLRGFFTSSVEVKSNFNISIMTA